MPLETASFISQLVSANPSSTDPLQQGENHIGLIKSVLQNQFPNLGTVAVSATAAALNMAAGGFTSAGTLEVVSNGTVAGGELQIDGVEGTGTVAAALPVVFLNSGTAGGVGGLSIEMAGTVGGTLAPVATLDSLGDLTIPGTLSAKSILQAGSAIIPPGIIVDWYGSIASIPAGWALCNGQTVNGFTTPNLTGKFVVFADGTTYTPGQTGGAGSATVATDSQGVHQHSGATGSAGAASPTGTTDTQGSHSHTGNTAGHSLTTPEMPAHSHEEFMGVGGSGGSGAVFTQFSSNAGATFDVGYTTGSAGNGTAHVHAISTDGAHAHNVTISGIPAHTHAVSTDGGHTHNVTVATLPPFYALVKIMKVS